jgi:prophage maintenance system killer protein
MTAADGRFKFVPLPLPYWLSLAKHVIEQDIGVLLERYEFGSIRHALCPLNVSHEGLDTVALCAGEAVQRLLRRHSSKRIVRIGHATAAGFLALNGYRLRIPRKQLSSYRSLLGGISDGVIQTEELARCFAAYSQRDPEYSRPNTARPSGLILLSAPVMGSSPKQLSPWYDALEPAVREAGERCGLNLAVCCPAQIPHGDPDRMLRTRIDILPRVDGQIVIGLKGDTTGGGHEQILLGLGRPWRWLQIGDTGISTSLRSWQAITSGHIEPVKTPAEAAKIAVTWICAECRRLALSIYRRETARLVSYRVQAELQRVWLAPGTDRSAIAADVGLAEGLIGLILFARGVFERIPLETLDPIAASMGVAFDTASAPRVSGTLERNEEVAIDTYVGDCKLDGLTALRLRGIGARLSAIERRRMGLGMPDGWEKLHRDLEH